MKYQWTRGDMVEIEYDTDTGLLSEGGAPGRAPTAEEQAFVQATFVNTPQGQVSGDPLQDLRASMAATLEKLRSVVEDQQVTQIEVGETMALLLPTLLTYSAVGDEGADRALMFRFDQIMARTSQALFILGGQTLTGTRAAVAAQAAQAARLDDLAARVAFLESQ